MMSTNRGNRFHIGILGKTNSGKSTLINEITNQDVSLVSEVSGTTTDPVYKAMELLPLGPVVFIDTAGYDDKTKLGKLRISKTDEIIEKLDISLLLIKAYDIVDLNIDDEINWLSKLKKKPIIVVITKYELLNLEEKEIFNKNIKKLSKFNVIIKEIEKIKEEIIKNLEKKEKNLLIGDKIKKGDKILLVAPQDIQAPKGRLILPQVQVLRDILDNLGIPTMVTLENLEAGMNFKPNLVIVDSQIFKIVNEKIDKNIPLTSFSIIMARNKGDLQIFYDGAKKINSLKSGDKVLIAEACTHHAMKGDIAREKIPKLLKDKIPGIIIENALGNSFPKNLGDYSLVIHCGSCMLNRAETMSRIEKCVNITNFGMAIAELNGILDRVTEIFGLR